MIITIPSYRFFVCYHETVSKGRIIFINISVLLYYEGRDFPEDIEVIDWQAYNFEERKPDAMYIMYPYDNWNLVTSIHPRFYSDNLKKYTDHLVYCPYYATSGGMSEGQKTLPAYFHADYIVIQSPSFRDYFDERLPAKKFLALGSPKFDRVIQRCENPPEPPQEWRRWMYKQDGERFVKRKVYFYNTSIGGMLGDTEAFLKKMRYVFDTFKGRDDACILWRPHPLLESTFDSMRPMYKSAYDELKQYYIENALGIYDTTPDITDAVAWSDAYVGDAASSVVSLFGITGKPVFILNNQLHSEPKEDSWRGEIIPGIMFNYFERDRFAITQGNKLYISEPYKYDFKYFCDLSAYSYGGYYLCVREVNGQKYVCPLNAQDILLLDDKGIKKRIQLAERVGQPGAFAGVWVHGKYLLLIPRTYPSLVRYNTETGEIKYLTDNIDVFVQENERHEKMVGGSFVYEGVLYVASPVDSRVYVLDIESGVSDVIELNTSAQAGCIGMFVFRGEMWMLPYRGQTVLRWNTKTGRLVEYTGFPEGFQCVHPTYKFLTDEYPFASWAFSGKYVYFSPNWGNMFLKLDTETGEYSAMRPPIELHEGKEYFYTWGKCAFISHVDNSDKYALFVWPERKLYDYDIKTNTVRNEIEIKFDAGELRQQEHGFNDSSKWLRYCCHENAFNSLQDFLDGDITGGQHDVAAQKKSYSKIAVNNDGSCGRKVHEFISRL